MPGVYLTEECDPNEMFEEIKEMRKNQTCSDLCFDNTEDLNSFYEEVFSYDFEDKPNYKKLRLILENLREIERYKNRS